jgi:hypothetical protein
MDQDFHYYGTYAAAKLAGWDDDRAHLAAKCANFVDFLNEKTYRGYWEIVKEIAIGSKKEKHVIGRFDAPRYTFQANWTGNMVGAEGSWGSFHFLPGNYKDTACKVGFGGSLAPEKTYPDWVIDGIAKSEGFVGRGETGSITGKHKLREDTPYGKVEKRLTRPMSALSRALLMDTVQLATRPELAEPILRNAPCAYYLLSDDKKQRAEIVERLVTILGGIRAHVIADTWAHQDFAGIHSDINTYWDWKSPANRLKGQCISLDDGAKDREATLGLMGCSKNLEAMWRIGNAVGNLGHAWMGHLPDFSFVVYKYRPAWSKKKEESVRNNPATFLSAFYELMNLFGKMIGGGKGKPSKEQMLDIAVVLRSGFDLTNKKTLTRVHSEALWQKMGALAAPAIQVKDEDPPSKETVLDGAWTYRKAKGDLFGATVHGTFVMELEHEGKVCDLYLFQLAADYHLQFVYEWLKANDIAVLKDSWVTDPGPLSFGVKEFIAQRFAELQK